MGTASADAATAFAEGLDRLLAFDADADDFFQRAIAADPSFSLPFVALAILRWQQNQGAAQATAYRARTLAARGTGRERTLAALAVAVVDGHGFIDDGGHQAPNAEAIALAHAHLEQVPRDALVLFVASILTIFSGHRSEQESLLALFVRLAPHYGDDWWFRSWHGFCYEETGRFEEGHRICLDAYESRPDNAIAAHAVGHVHYEDGEDERGAAFLGEWLVGYDRRALYHSHISWHYALFELATGNPGRALEVYVTAIDPAVAVPARTTLADSVGLLWRCMLSGAERDALPWDGIHSFAAGAVNHPGVPFRDLLAAAAFAGAGDETRLDRLAGGLRELDSAGHPLAGAVVLPLVEGMRAFARGEYGEAISQMWPVMPTLGRIGGSHQQRELYEEIVIEALLRARQTDSAEAFLRERLRTRSSARDRRWLARVASAAGAADVGIVGRL